MDETLGQIEAHIDQTRDRLGANLKELERRVDVATDWREQFYARPYVALGLAVAGGMLLARVAGSRSPRQLSAMSDDMTGRLRSGRGSDIREQALETWDNIKGALVGVATARVTDYISELVPGFADHLRDPRQKPLAR